jgi:tetratricopeptide (TPR) repeat protein
LLLQRNEFKLALQNLKNLKPQGDLESPARLFTANALYGVGLLKEAEKCVAPLTKDPEYAADAHRWLAAIYYDMGANTASLTHLQLLIQLAPDDYKPRALAARMYQDFAQYNAAVEHLLAALDLTPPPTERNRLILELGRTQIKLRDYESAFTTFDTATVTAAQLALKSECLQHLGRIGEAMSCLDAAVAMEPHNPDVLSCQANVLLSENNADEAARILSQLASQTPYDHDVRYRLAMAYRQAGQPDKAKTELSRVDELRRQYDQLSELNNQAILRPDDVAVRRELASLCETLGRTKLARVWTIAADALEHSTPATPGLP